MSVSDFWDYLRKREGSFKLIPVYIISENRIILYRSLMFTTLIPDMMLSQGKHDFGIFW